MASLSVILGANRSLGSIVLLLTRVGPALAQKGPHDEHTPAPPLWLRCLELAFFGANCTAGTAPRSARAMQN